MQSRPLSIAILAANPALAAILARALEIDGEHHVARLGGVEALIAYLRSNPVDMVVLDTEMPGAPAADLARGLRSLPLRSDDFTIVALTQLKGSAHDALHAAGIDEVLVKPVLPARLVALAESLAEPVLKVANGGVAGVIAGASVQTGNVIQLFGEGRARR